MPDRPVGDSRSRATRQLVAVAFVYAGSVGVLLIGEILLARGVTADEFGQYNLVKQAVPVVCALGLLGLDQALTRETAALRRPSKIGSAGWFAVLRVGGVAAIFAIYLVVATDMTPISAFSLVVAGVGVAVSSIVSGIIRATGNPLVAALGQQGYRLLTGFVLIFALSALPSNSATWVVAISALSVAVWCVHLASRFTAPWTPKPNELRVLKRLGLSYTLGMLGLATSDWVDQAMIAQLASPASTGHYAQAKLFAVYPLMSIGSVLGFVALPAIARRRSSLKAVTVRRWLLVAAASSPFLLLLFVPAAIIATGLIFGDIASNWVIATLSLVGALRLFYVLPSAILGAIGTVGDLAQAGAVSFAAVVVQVVVTLSVTSFGLLQAAAIGLAANVVIRVAFTTWLCFRASSRKQPYGDDRVTT